MLKLGKCLDGEEESDKVIPWTALASSQSKINKHDSWFFRFLFTTAHIGGLFRIYSALVRVLELWVLTVKDWSKITGADSNRLSKNHGC